MRIFTFKYKKNLKVDVLAKMKKAISSGVPSIQSDTLYFDHLGDLMRSASSTRLELFQCILEKHPGSLYELAQLINKDQAQVLREAKALESLGLILLSKTLVGNKEKLKPEALYDKIVIDVEFKQEKEVA